MVFPPYLCAWICALWAPAFIECQRVDVQRYGLELLISLDFLSERPKRQVNGSTDRYLQNHACTRCGACASGGDSALGRRPLSRRSGWQGSAVTGIQDVQAVGVRARCHGVARQLLVECRWRFRADSADWRRLLSSCTGQCLRLTRSSQHKRDKFMPSATLRQRRSSLWWWRRADDGDLELAAL